MLPDINNLNFKELAEFIKANAFDFNYELFETADKIRKKFYGNKVYLRGLIEFTNYCKNGCFYCGINNKNQNVKRYRLDKETILNCCKEGFRLGFKTFVLQGGEDPFFDDDKIVDIIKSIKERYPECALTLSMGEKKRESYKKYFDAGADRYLLRHETASKEHYNKLHPKNMSYENRIRCLNDLKEIGFQTGAGFMVGSPYQTYENLAKDLLFIKNLKPQMVGIGPFIPQKETIFCSEKQGSLTLTLTMLSLTRILLPNVLLPSTTALGTIDKKGRMMGIKCGCNVIMPNLSPMDSRKNYQLYDNKPFIGNETCENLKILKNEIEEAGYEIDMARGDYKI